MSILDVLLALYLVIILQWLCFSIYFQETTLCYMSYNINVVTSVIALSIKTL